VIGYIGVIGFIEKVDEKGLSVMLLVMFFVDDDSDICFLL